MSRKSAPHIDIVKQEDKESRLKSFILAHPGLYADDAVSSELADIRVIARSPSSPVIKALSALVAEQAIRGPIRAVFAVTGEPGPGDNFAGDEVFQWRRLPRDMRLLDVHEQMVIGKVTSWIGDCMRRDPNKRDAYECFAGDCAKTAGWANTSFERLWASSSPRKCSSDAGMISPRLEACIPAAALDLDQRDDSRPERG